MPVLIPPRPGLATLDGLVVGRPVAAGHMQQLAADLAHLTGYCLPVVCSQSFESVNATAVAVRYVRSPGARVLLVEVEARHGGGGDAAVTGAVSASSGSVSVIDAGENILDGATEFAVSSRTTVSRPVWRAYVDVTGLTVGTAVLLAITLTNTGAGTAYLHRLHVAEVPLATASPVDDPAGEVGIDSAWPQARNAIVAGDEGATYARGWRRVFAQMAKARKDVRRHFNLSGAGWSSELTAVGSDFPFNVGANPTFRVRARMLYQSPQSNAYQLRAFYTAASGTFTLRCAVTAVGSGVTTNTDLSLPTSASPATASTAITLPTSGTSQEVDLQFFLWRASGTAGVTVHNVSLIEDEA